MNAVHPYEKPELQLVCFVSGDIITTSELPPELGDWDMEM